MTENTTIQETEVLDELSKKTLGSYIKKASSDAASKKFRAGDILGHNKDVEGSISLLKKSNNRSRNIVRAVDKLTKEELEVTEVEQIEELSKDTLKSYVVKAAVDQHKHNDDKKAHDNVRMKTRNPNNIAKDDLESEENFSDRKDRLKNRIAKAKAGSDAAGRKSTNRSVGVFRASKKLHLNKEEIEMTDKTENVVAEDIVDTEVVETTAADSLAPGKAPGMSKAAALSDLLSKVAGMSIEDFSKWHNEALEASKKFGDGVPSGNASKNKNSINMHGVKEEAAALFVGEELTEEAKEKITTVLEAVIHNSLVVKEAELEEAYEAALEEAKDEFIETLTAATDLYLEDATKTFMEENAVAIEATLRSEIVESFIDGIKNVFTEHYVEIPEDKVNVVEELASTVEQLEEKVNKLLEENAALKEETLLASRAEVVESFTSTLKTQIDAEKFKTLSEAIEFTDKDSFTNKLTVIAEKFFAKKPSVETNLNEETFEPEVTKTSTSPASVQRYAAAIRKLNS